MSECGDKCKCNEYKSMTEIQKLSANGEDIIVIKIPPNIPMIGVIDFFKYHKEQFAPHKVVFCDHETEIYKLGKSQDVIEKLDEILDVIKEI